MEQLKVELILVEKEVNELDQKLKMIKESRSVKMKEKVELM